MTAASVPAGRSLFRAAELIGDILSRPSGAIGLTLVALHLLIALAAPLIVPYDYKAISSLLMLKPPSTAHWLGTDHIGRDVLTRTLLGGREALLVTTIATPIAVLWGGFLGILFGLSGGWLDDMAMRLVDAVLSLPKILFVLTAAAVLGAEPIVLVPMLAFFYGVPVIRVARAATHDVVARDFVTASRARGHSRFDIIMREILPNVRDVLLVEGAMRWSWMLLTFSSLSFLGFGVSPPTPDWGLMIKDASPVMSFAWWAVLAPIAALSTLIVGINLSADALAKALGIDRAQKAPV
ncbi:MAG: ABC transporter permease [Hyphomicrobiaceae bacterium]